MTKADKAILKDLENCFSGEYLKAAQELYLKHYGGEGGCEECQEYWAICEECYDALHNDVRKMFRGIF
jgi:hypothetical protein